MRAGAGGELGVRWRGERGRELGWEPGAALVEMAVFQPTQTLQESGMTEFTAGAGEGAGARAAQLSSTLPRAHGADGRNGGINSTGDNRLEKDSRSGGGKGEIVVREFLGPCEPCRSCRLVAGCLTAGQAHFQVYFEVLVVQCIFVTDEHACCIAFKLCCCGAYEGTRHGSTHFVTVYFSQCGCMYPTTMLRRILSLL